MCVTVTVVTGHSVALSRRSHLFSTMSSLHDVLVHDIFLFIKFPKVALSNVTSQCTRRLLDVGNDSLPRPKRILPIEVTFSCATMAIRHNFV
jgi:hypothetical protein